MGLSHKYLQYCLTSKIHLYLLQECHITTQNTDALNIITKKINMSNIVPN